MYDCSLCPRTVCSDCAKLPLSLEAFGQPSVKFICPACHISTSAGKPYVVCPNDSQSEHIHICP
jgi:hypothetical protein